MEHVQIAHNIPPHGNTEEPSMYELVGFCLSCMSGLSIVMGQQRWMLHELGTTRTWCDWVKCDEYIRRLFSTRKLYRHFELLWYAKFVCCSFHNSFLQLPTCQVIFFPLWGHFSVYAIFNNHEDCSFWPIWYLLWNFSSQQLCFLWLRLPHRVSWKAIFCLIACPRHMTYIRIKVCQ